MVNWKTAADLGADDLYFKVLIYGDAGSGKTWHAAQSTVAGDGADVFVLLTEQNGVQTARHANPRARIILVHSVAEVGEVLDQASSGELAAMGCRVLVVDGLTEIQQLIKRAIADARGDGEFSERDWGACHEAFKRLLSRLRALPLHVVCTALAASEKEEESGRRFIFPSFQGPKIPNATMQFFNVVGYVFKKAPKKEGGDWQHPVMVDGPDKYATKACVPLRGVLETPISEWLKALAAPVGAHGRAVTDSDVRDADATEPASADANADAVGKPIPPEPAHEDGKSTDEKKPGRLPRRKGAGEAA